MKWFKHFADSYSNFKLQNVLSELGTDGYGLFWICVEIVAQQGVNHQIDAKKSWKKVLAHIARKSEQDIDKSLQLFAEYNLIDKNGLNKGNLYIPKLRSYSDEYTDKVRRMSGQGRDKVRLDKIRLDKIRLDYIAAHFGAAPAIAEILSLFQKESNTEINATNADKNAAAAKKILAAGYTPDDVTKTMHHLQGLDYLDKWDLGTVQKYIAAVKAGKVKEHDLTEEEFQAMLKSGEIS